MRTFLCRVLTLCFFFNLCGGSQAFAQYMGPGYFQNRTPSANWTRTVKQSEGTNIRQFIKNGNPEEVLNYLKDANFPKENYSLGLLQYVPGMYITKTSESTDNAAIARLQTLLEQDQIPLPTLLELVDAPSYAVSTFSVTALIPLFNSVDQLINDPETKPYIIQIFIPQVQQLLLNRLKKAEAAPASSSGVGRFLEKNLRLQYRDANNVALQGYILLTLGKIYTAGRKAGFKTLTQEQYKTLIQKAMNLFTYTHTHYEFWEGPSAERVLAAQLATMALIAYEGPDGFKRVVDKLEESNTYTRLVTPSASSFDVKKQNFPNQNNLAPDNFLLLKQAFDALNAEYSPKLGRISKAEKVKVGNMLVRYINKGSAATRVLAAGLLTQWYDKTRTLGEDKMFITHQQANQIADIIKNVYYCPLKRATKRGVFHLNGQQINEMLAQLSIIYQRVRRDSGYITAPGQPVPCFVSSGKNNVNLSVKAADLADEATWFIVSWGLYGKAFSWMAKGGRYLANLTRAVKVAAKTGRSIPTVMREARVAARLTKELNKNGIQVTRTAVTSKGKTVTTDLAKPRVAPQSETWKGFTFTQQLPGGKLTQQQYGPARNALGNAAAKFSPEFQHFNSIAQSYLGKFSAYTPAQLSAYRSALATDRILYAGLSEISAQNFASGYRMAPQWMTDKAGKKFMQYEPRWLKLTPESPVQHVTAYGRPIYGNIRADLLPTVQTPGAILTASLWKPTQMAMGWLGGITLAEGTIDALDFAADFAVQKWDVYQQQRNELLEEGKISTPDISAGEIFRRNLAQNPFNNPSYSGSILQIPYIALAGAWQLGKDSLFPMADFQTRLRHNPYMSAWKNPYMQLWEEEAVYDDAFAPDTAEEEEEYFLPQETEYGEELDIPIELEEPDYEEDFDPYF